MARRALEIGSIVAAAQAQGLCVAFLTLTMRHSKGDRLETLWDALAASWKDTISGRQWRNEIAAFDIRGWVRVVEVTYGENGWHVHVHALVIGSDWASEDLDELAGGMWNRWSRAVQRAGLRAPLPQASEWHLIGGDLSGTKLGEYLAKGASGAAAIGMEMTQTQSKVARGVHKTRQVWHLLDDAADGEVAPVRLWHEWERGSKGRRQIGWSKGVREAFDLEDERSDEEIAAEELGSTADTLVWITPAGWGELVRRPQLLPDVLTMAEHGGQEGLSQWLWGNGIDHRRV